MTFLHFVLLFFLFCFFFLCVFVLVCFVFLHRRSSDGFCMGLCTPKSTLTSVEILTDRIFDFFFYTQLPGKLGKRVFFYYTHKRSLEEK